MCKYSQLIQAIVFGLVAMNEGALAQDPRCDYFDLSAEAGVMRDNAPPPVAATVTWPASLSPGETRFLANLHGYALPVAPHNINGMPIPMRSGHEAAIVSNYSYLANTGKNMVITAGKGPDGVGFGYQNTFNLSADGRTARVEFVYNYRNSRITSFNHANQLRQIQSKFPIYNGGAKGGGIIGYQMAFYNRQNPSRAMSSDMITKVVFHMSGPLAAYRSLPLKTLLNLEEFTYAKRRFSALGLGNPSDYEVSPTGDFMFHFPGNPK